VAGNGIALAFTGMRPRSLRASSGSGVRASGDSLDDVQTGQGVQSLKIKLTTDPSACAREQAAALLAGASQLELDLTAGESGIGAGTFSVGSPTSSSGASALASTMDSACQEKLADADRTAATGQVVLSKVTATSVSGSLDLVFPKGEHIKGDFRVPVCPVAQQAQTPPSCQMP
jgi:hypothetical protein